MAMLDIIAKDHKQWIDICLNYGAGDYSEDIVQDMYLKIAENKNKLDLKNNYKSYIYGALRYLCLDYHRNNNFDISLIDNLTEDNCKTDGRLELLDIHQAVENLSYLEKRVIQLNKIEGIGLWEIEKHTGLNRKYLWDAKKSAIDKLRKTLNE